ncbi:hypothetical protein GCM10007415_31960 [Parapedobacter pyrenivorans]|uniref:Uncharacterized protein n=1 Tax=Parapedobacter pyrenivorans TaxID=1305674 RepID=A0A917HWC7_9SPHI|nr:hypothetical protein GCM10007415_31960 [Parapedobacter pyrenivorans]
MVFLKVQARLKGLYDRAIDKVNTFFALILVYFIQREPVSRKTNLVGLIINNMYIRIRLILGLQNGLSFS